jgi:2-polyprenyl-6-methoxyphenol hydroxylase-like FAD-dependent oxidoreductase
MPHTNHAKTQVLIVGAGPTGLTLACELARRKISFQIVDKEPRYPSGSRGKGLQPRSLEVLEDLGVINEILAAGRFHMRFRAYDGAKVVGERDWHEGRVPTSDVPYASTLIIPQWRVEEILRDRLAALGGTVELGTRLAGLTQDEAGVTTTLARGDLNEEVRVDHLVGCDGGHSVVRRLMGLELKGETDETQRMWVGDVEADGLDRDYWHVWPKAAGGPIALCPLPGTSSFQFEAVVTDEAAPEPSIEIFQKTFNERTGRSDIRLHNPTWLSLYRANVRMVDRYRVGRAFLAGDAAHVHSPAGGQGMNTGIQDAYNLGWKLERALKLGCDELLHTYEEERLPIAAWLLEITSKLHRQGIKGGGNESRDPETLQLQLNYRGSLLSQDDRESPGKVRAGDRAPDAPCLDNAGDPIRLFDLFRGPHFTLLAFGAARENIVAQVNARYGALVRAFHLIRPGEKGGSRPIVDFGEHARTAYDIDRDALVLVRPDGYIGLFADSAPVDRLTHYLCLRPSLETGFCPCTS